MVGLHVAVVVALCALMLRLRHDVAALATWLATKGQEEVEGMEEGIEGKLYGWEGKRKGGCLLALVARANSLRRYRLRGSLLRLTLIVCALKAHVVTCSKKQVLSANVNVEFKLRA